MEEVKINGLEKLLNKVIVMTGRNEDIEYVASKIVEKVENIVLLHLPSETDFYQDYPLIIEKCAAESSGYEGRLIIATQSDEFLCCLLKSPIEFQLVTVKHGQYQMYLRVLSKQRAVEDKETFNMELRA